MEDQNDRVLNLDTNFTEKDMKDCLTQATAFFWPKEENIIFCCVDRKSRCSIECAACREIYSGEKKVGNKVYGIFEIYCMMIPGKMEYKKIGVCRYKTDESEV